MTLAVGFLTALLAGIVLAAEVGVVFLVVLAALAALVKGM